MTDHKSPVKKPSIHVIFRKIEESYLVNTDITVHYSISGALEVNSNDWIGLYRVGWRSHSDYIYYEWSPNSNDCEGSSDNENKVVFPAKRLPKDDGEFYQFCYVTSSGQVQGASTPFQFKSIMVDDLVEDEDENNEIVVVKTKTSFLEDNLEKANNLNSILKEKIQILECDIEVLHLAERDWSLKFQKIKDKEEDLKHLLKEKCEVLSEQKQNNSHLQDCINGLQEKLDILEQEKHSMEKRLDDNDLYISSLQEKIKNLVTEKDTLNGAVRVMEEEFKKTFQEREVLKFKLAEEEMKYGKCRKEIEQATVELATLKQIHNELAKISNEDKNLIGNLSERLQNAEDKLSAAEHCKMMLNEEVLNLKVAHEGTLLEYEISQNEVKSLNGKINELEVLHSNEKKALEEGRLVQESALCSRMEEISSMENMCDRLTKEVERLEAEVKKQDENGSLFALQTAHQNLVERYGSLSKKFETMQKTCNSFRLEKKELEIENSELSNDNKSMRERIVMCQQAYKVKHSECEALKAQLMEMSSPDKADDDQNSSDVCGLNENLRKYKKLLWKEGAKREELYRKLDDKDKEIERLKEILSMTETEMIYEEERETSERDGGTKEQIPSQSSEDQKLLEGLTLCPFCSVSFEGCDDNAITNHVENHMDNEIECPICKKNFDGCNREEEAMQHVQSHFN